MDLGAAGHGEYNWQKALDGAGDPDFARESFNHLMEHLVRWRTEVATGDATDDHLAAIRCGAAFLMAMEDHCPDALREAFRSV